LQYCQASHDRLPFNKGLAARGRFLMRGKISRLNSVVLAAYGRRMQPQQTPHVKALFDDDTIDGLNELGAVLLDIHRRLTSEGIMIESEKHAKSYAEQQ